MVSVILSVEDNGWFEDTHRFVTTINVTFGRLVVSPFAFHMDLIAAIHKVSCQTSLSRR